MKKFEIGDGEFILHEGPIEDFVKPSKGDFIRIDETNYEVEMIIHHYDKEKIIVVVKEKK